MFGFEDPIYVVSASLLLLLAFFGIYQMFAIWRHRTFLSKKHFSVLSVNQDVLGVNLQEFIRSIKPPFSFEIAIHNIGREVNYYIVLPKKRAKRFIAMDGVNEVSDYELFHSDGSHIGMYFKDGDKWPELDLNKVDFSKVNDLGEGVVLQMVFGSAPLLEKLKGNPVAVNFRLLVSAPSDYQAKEIAHSLRNGFGEYKAVEVRGEDFAHVVNFREFSTKERMIWR